MKNKTLVVLAGGIGSRFGGLKQVEQIGPQKEFIMDYSIYDAIKCGFNKVIFIINKENYILFLNTIGKRIKNKIKVEYVFQENPINRNKPLGTAHAILCAKDLIKEPFLIINSDDYYGYDAFNEASNYMDNIKKELVVVAYPLKNTLSKYGSVKRGILNFKNDKLISINETIINKNNYLIYLKNNETFVSMNLFIFVPDFFGYLEKKFNNYKFKDDNDEFLLPDILNKAIKDKAIDIHVIKTNSKWIGMTYKEDKEDVMNCIYRLIEDNQYPKDLWG